MKNCIGTFFDQEEQAQKTTFYRQKAKAHDGRSRLHGAFTGGFSAGLNNTCASKEGFVPKQFRSSGQKRTYFRHSALDYMDQQDKGELDLKSIVAAGPAPGAGVKNLEALFKEKDSSVGRRIVDRWLSESTASGAKSAQILFRQSLDARHQKLEAVRVDQGRGYRGVGWTIEQEDKSNPAQMLFDRLKPMSLQLHDEVPPSQKRVTTDFSQPLEEEPLYQQEEVVEQPQRERVRQTRFRTLAQMFGAQKTCSYPVDPAALEFIEGRVIKAPSDFVFSRPDKSYEHKPQKQQPRRVIYAGQQWDQPKQQRYMQFCEQMQGRKLGGIEQGRSWEQIQEEREEFTQQYSARQKEDRQRLLAQPLNVGRGRQEYFWTPSARLKRLMKVS